MAAALHNTFYDHGPLLVVTLSSEWIENWYVKKVIHMYRDFRNVCMTRMEDFNYLVLG